MKVFISGVAGYLGTRIAEILLDSSFEVVGVDNFIYNNQFSVLHLLNRTKFSLHCIDVRDTGALQKLIKDCDVIMPLAAIVGAPACDHNPNYAEEINEHAIKNLIPLLSKNQKLVFPQTNSGYGVNNESVCTEESPLNPISVYGVTKCNAEKAVLDHINSVSLRLATVYGHSTRPRFDLMVNFFVSELYYNKNITVYEPHFRRNFVHICDVAKAFRFFSLSKITGIFNIGNDADNLTKLKLAELIAKDMHKDDYASFIKIGQGEDKDKRDYEVSSEKVRKAGFEFKFNLTDGIREVKKICSIFSKNQIDKFNNVQKA